MNNAIKQLCIKNKYFVLVKQNSEHNNVFTVVYPRMIGENSRPPLSIQYYIDSDSIIITDLKTKKNKTIKVTSITKRLAIYLDIILTCLRRGVNMHLIVPYDKHNHQKKKLISLFPMEKSLVKEEKKLFDFVPAIILDSEMEESDDPHLEVLRQIKESEEF